MALVWEVLLARSFGRDGDPPAGLRGALGAQARPKFFDVLEDAGAFARAEHLNEALAAAAEGVAAARADVVTALFGAQATATAPANDAAASFASASRLLRPPSSLGSAAAAAWKSLASRAVVERSKKATVQEPAKARAARSPAATPAAAPPAREDNYTVAPKPRALPASLRDSGVTRRPMLVVHGDDAERRCLCDSLRVAGNRVLDVGDAAAALTTALACPPVLILVEADLRLPSGEDLVRKLREQPEIGSVPIVTLASPRTTRSRSTDFATGPDLRLSTPIEPAALLAELSRLLGMARELPIARRAIAAATGSVDTILRGEITAMPITALAAMLDAERRTGLVRASNPEHSYAIEIAGGRVVRGWIEGEAAATFDAMRGLASLESGVYSFHGLAPKPPPAHAVDLYTLLVAAKTSRSGASAAAR